MERLEEGRPYWGAGGDDVRVMLPDGEEKEGVQAAFVKTLPAHGIDRMSLQILQIERVQNAELWTCFAAKRLAMLQRAGAIDSWERAWLFHGTDQDTVPKIVAQGFNRSYCGKNATKYGKGVYFAVESEYSTRDCYSRPNAAGECFIFLCRVLVGEFCQGEEDGVAPAVRCGDVLYDSTVDNPRDPKIFVTYHDAQAYPEYLVKFRRN
jgi:poly [ADP-ribose] polymerase 10/14/15